MSATPERGPDLTVAASSPNVSPAWRIALGFDFGQRRIGVAVGDAITGSARPLCILPIGEPYWNAIARLIAEWRPDGLVVGVPHPADDTAHAMMAAALRFSRQLHGRFLLPVATIDERLSSWEAEQRQFASASRRQKRRTPLDAQAAAIILESWFNQRLLDPPFAKEV